MPKFCLLISNSNREIILSTPPICKIIRDPSTRSKRNMWKKWRSSTCDKNWSNKSNHRTFDVLSFDWCLDTGQSRELELWFMITHEYLRLKELQDDTFTLSVHLQMHNIIKPSHERGRQLISKDLLQTAVGWRRGNVTSCRFHKAV